VTSNTFLCIIDQTPSMSDHSHTNGKDHYNEGDERTAALNRLRSAASVTIDPELFEKLYLSPPNKVKGDLRKTFGNPTPMYGPLSQQLRL
jgi:hypothetical protein